MIDWPRVLKTYIRLCKNWWQLFGICGTGKTMMLPNRDEKSGDGKSFSNGDIFVVFPRTISLFLFSVIFFTELPFVIQTFDQTLSTPQSNGQWTKDTKIKLYSLAFVFKNSLKKNEIKWNTANGQSWVLVQQVLQVFKNSDLFVFFYQVVLISCMLTGIFLQLLIFPCWHFAIF